MTASPLARFGGKGLGEAAPGEDDAADLAQGQAAADAAEKAKQRPKVRKTPSRPRSWANFSLLYLYFHRNAWANLYILGQPDTFLAEAARHGGLPRLAGRTPHDGPGPPGAFK
jgi:hypothetical protein